ncbi:glycerol-3-phosphate dehydrogenase/oxidase [Aliikangiella sp. G2MR2-5]|uniref:glycerol-3-phosphate dehydrogenase/oxidase n=1 Tax=Aliikangiella sp. G2MR2-5 TaxID=2788943 RepID=UPI0018ABD2A5|nr:glycerol-3-phosphate dehydrogenase/oxidase [Aliikangiella sp. G2MR2-5]
MAEKNALKIAVVGGGINGLCCAWQLALNGHQVTLFEKDELMGKTSTASTKLLHGGLRYLENFEFRLVKEALHERQWWLNNVPGLTRRLPILYPLYNHTRSRWKIKLGLMLYDFLAGNKGIGKHRWLTRKQVKRCSPKLLQRGLKGAYLFIDGQMDDRALGLWVAEQCEKESVKFRTNTQVTAIDASGVLSVKTSTATDSKLADSKLEFDRIINVAGPWSAQLLEDSNVESRQTLDLVRGSHLIVPPISKFGHLLEVPDEKRVAFVLPFKNRTLLGTTEVRQKISDPIKCSREEQNYLLSLYNYYFEPNIQPDDIEASFSGLRPLLGGSEDAGKASREYRIVRQNRLISIFGGKWTTARALARSLLKHL